MPPYRDSLRTGVEQFQNHNAANADERAVVPSSIPARISAGLDHLMIMVHDLQVASDDFAKLGFRVQPGTRFPYGIENAVIPFGSDGGYLELVSVYKRGNPLLQDNEEFLAQAEGAIYAGLKVDSVDEVAKRLRAIGLEVSGPTPWNFTPEGTNDPPTVLWQNLTIAHGSSPRSDPLFFIEYNDAGRAEAETKSPEYFRKYTEGRSLPHPNGARRLGAVWFAVDNLNDAANRYDALGLPRTRDFAVNRPDGHAVEFGLDAGTVLLLQGASEGGPLRQLLTLHQTTMEVPGVSVEIASVESALAGMSPELVKSLDSTSGPMGRGVLIPPELAHGLWLELFEPSGSPS
jgi:catechol 2,3-dioxygenase-like lactoylglutathione lyase family enzyme